MKAAYHDKARCLLNVVLIGTIVGMFFLSVANTGVAQEVPLAPLAFYGNSYYNWPINYIYLNCEVDASCTTILIYRGETQNNLTLIAALDAPFGVVVSGVPDSDYYPSGDYIYVDRDVEIGHTYFYQVSAGGLSDIIEVYHASPAPGATAPSPPQNVIASGGNGQITIAWDAPEDGGSMITEFILYRRILPALTPNSNVNMKSVSLGQTSTSYVDTDIENQQIYYYMICAKNAMGYGNTSVEVSTMASDAYALPSAPRSLQVIIGENHNDITWNAPADNGGSTILYYNIYRGTAEGQEVFYQKVRNVQNFTDTNIVAGQDYFYTVSAINGVGEGPQSKVTDANGIPGFTYGIMIIATLLALLMVGATKKLRN